MPQISLKDRRMPPVATENLGQPGQTLYQVQRVAVGVAAVNFDWVAALETALGYKIPGWVNLYLETDSALCYVRFKPSTSAAATTATNGLIVLSPNAGWGGSQQGASFYVSPRLHRVIDVLASATDNLRVQVCSPPSAERYDQQ